MTYWPHFEDRFLELFGDLLGGGRDHAHAIWRQILGANSRMQLLQTMFRATVLSDEQRNFIKSCTDEFAELNLLRNRYAHDLWWTDMETGLVYLNRVSSNFDENYDTREITVQELKKFTTRMEETERKIAFRFAHRATR